MSTVPLEIGVGVLVAILVAVVLALPKLLKRALSRQDNLNEIASMAPDLRLIRQLVFGDPKLGVQGLPDRVTKLAEASKQAHEEIWQELRRKQDKGTQ